MKKIPKKIILCAGAVILLFCTAISVYGILTAPESDQNELEEELRRNEQRQSNQITQQQQLNRKRKAFRLLGIPFS